jgi:uncharacterized repeat protein (TIGR01451 family)
MDGRTQLKFDIGTLRSGQSRNITAELRPSRTGVYVNKAVAVSSSGIRAESAATATSVRQPILAMMKTCPERQYLGRPLSYEIMVMNKGDGPAYDTTLVDVIPSGVSAVEASAGADISGGKLSWQLGTVPANSSKTVKVSYKPNATGVLMSTATVSAHCAKTITAEAKTAVVGIPALRLDVVDLEDPIELGSTVTYLITVTNEGSASDNNIRIICHLEENLQYVSSSGASQATLMGRTLSFLPLRSVAPNETATWRIVSKAIRPGGVRFKVTLSSDALARPVEETEATFLYQ